MPVMSDAITVGYREGSKVGRQLLVKAKGKPANIVAFGVAAGIAGVGIGLGYAVKHLLESRNKQRKLPSPR